MDARPRLLVVDDEILQLDALSQVLREEGYEVRACTQPHEALQALREGGFDVLLCDLNMPGMDGIALTREALAIDADLVPVLMTGQGSIPTAIEAMKVGALDYVLKPFRMAAMRPVLVRAAEMRKLRVGNRRLKEDLERRNVQLVAANRELDAFAARIAHDLRGPVMGMLGFARILHERGAAGLTQEQRGFLQRVVSAGERAERMIRDLLNFARLGESTMRREPVSLDDVVLAARKAVQGDEEGRHVDWHIGRLPTVHGDEALLELVFVNLLSNALKYTRPRAHASVEIGSCAAPEGGHVVWVRDNGVGFDPSHANRLFTPFQRLHSAQQFEGQGIGLANVKRIVERHGGAVAAEGAPGAGATITVTLPA
ncbi:MAG TPA: response regulator [Burkholderiales bacterium]|nr:response regulator [Burkholderiales bacterium]